MAFRMNRPVIKGTANHKASIAKAKAEPVVSQSRTKGDASLVGAAADLGKSYIPAAIDYSIDQKGIEFLDIKKEKKKEKQPKLKKSKSDYGNYEEYLAEEKELQKNIDDKDYQAYLDQESGSGTSDENLPSREQWKKNLKKPSYKPLSKKDWTDLNVEAGMKRPKVKKEKGKNIKEAKTTASTNYTVNKRDLVLKGGNWVPKEGAVSKEDDHAIWDGKQWTDNPKYMDKAIIRPFGDEDVTNKKKKGQVYELGSIKTEGVGNKQINQYTKEQRERLNTGEEGGNVWSEEEERYVLPEEIVDGKFVSKAEGEKIQILESDKFSGDNQTNKTVVEEKKTLSNLEIRKKKAADKKYNNPNTSQYIKNQMLKEGYVPPVSITENSRPAGTPGGTKVQQTKVFNDWKKDNNIPKGTKLTQEQIEEFSEYEYNVDYTKVGGKSPMDMRDNRIYRNAIKGGVVQQNMIKSGYIPE